MERYLEVDVEAQTPMGDPVRFRAHGWQARILQHEVDHLKVPCSQAEDPSGMTCCFRIARHRAHGPYVRLRGILYRLRFHCSCFSLSSLLTPLTCPRKCWVWACRTISKSSNDPTDCRASCTWIAWCRAVWCLAMAPGTINIQQLLSI